MTTSRKVLVVGGNGFIGSHVVDALRSAGHQVRVLSPQPELFRPPYDDVDYHFGRLELGTHLEPVLENCEIVIDAVAASVPALADQSPASTVASSVGATAWLGELSIRAGAQALIYLSSGGTVYGRADDGHAHHENDALAPIGVYGASKAAAELTLGALLGNTGVRSVILRLTNAYGERQNPTRPQGIVGVALNRYRAGQPITLFGNTVRDFVHAADVAAAVVRAIEPDVSGTYNIGSGEGVSMVEVLDRLQTLVGARFEIEHLPARPFDVPHSVVDIGRARSLGWAPVVTLEDGLRRTWEWYRHNAR